MGKQIRIYLADGSPSGIRHAEITNWTGQAIACPRTRFQDLREWQEAKRPGVYFLFGRDDETGEDAAYIGEAEIVIERLANHISGKDFWNEVIAFTSKDDNLTKGHVRYLESRLIQIALGAGRYKILNSAEPQLPSLPRPDRDAMEEYLESAKTLIGVLGHRLLEPFIPLPKQPYVSSFPQIPVANVTSVASPAETFLASGAAIFKLKISGLECHAIRTDEGLVVLENSEVAASVQTSIAIGYKNLREQLLNQGILTPMGSKLKFTKNHLFNSPSQAASVIVGYAINGRNAWKLSDGTTYGSYEHQLSTCALSELSPAVDAPCLSPADVSDSSVDNL